MTTKEEDQKEIQNIDENENPEEQEEEQEEPVDVELQKEMKGLTISDKDFVKEPKTKKPQKKQKEPAEKKSKKKGQDFLDYANKNNIQINFEYEENKYQLKKTEDPKMNDKYKYNEKKQYNKGGNKQQQNKNRQFKRNKMSGNKFDIGLRDYYSYNYPQSSIQLKDDKEILDHLEKIFGTENLNKDLYIRYRIKDGKILVDDIAKYNDFKSNKVDSQKIIDILKENKNLEIVNEDNKNYIKIKDFDETKLLTTQQISDMKKNQRMQRMPMNNTGNQQFYQPYLNFTNNVFICGQPYYYPNPYYANYMNQDNNK